MPASLSLSHPEPPGRRRSVAPRDVLQGRSGQVRGMWPTGEENPDPLATTAPQGPLKDLKAAL